MRKVIPLIDMARVPCTITKFVFVALFIGFGATGTAREVQDHGIWFEQWLCDTFFDGYRPNQYTQKWDIPAEANSRHGHLPVNPKATKLGSPIGLGDALRQFEIASGSESFILVVGFWQQSTPTAKKWVNIQASTITPAQWSKIWHPITRTDLEKLDAAIKDTSRSLEETRRLAQEIKSQPPFNKAIIVVNPKIDRSQRRLQCSLGFNALFDHLLPGVSREPQHSPTIWGSPIPNLTNTPPRMFGN